MVGPGHLRDGSVLSYPKIGRLNGTFFGISFYYQFLGSPVPVPQLFSLYHQKISYQTRTGLRNLLFAENLRKICNYEKCSIPPFFTFQHMFHTGNFPSVSQIFNPPQLHPLNWGSSKNSFFHHRAPSSIFDVKPRVIRQVRLSHVFLMGIKTKN